MTLPESYEAVRPSIVALGSRFTQTEPGGTPLFPTIIGTGFVVDQRGIVATNRHVAEELQRMPRHPSSGAHSATAILFTKTQSISGMVALGLAFVDIKRYNILQTFSSYGPYYGEMPPDLAFLQLNVRDVPSLSLDTEPNTLQTGMAIATAGFAMGIDPLVAYSKITQLTPLLRHGIISSLYPFPCEYPHGFTIDIMSQGGESGSPIFLTDSPRVVGILHAGFANSNVTICIPSKLVNDALKTCIDAEPLDIADVPKFKSFISPPGNFNVLNWENLGPLRSQNGTSSE